MYDWRKMTPRERRQVLAQRKLSGHPWHRPAHMDWGLNAYHLAAACYEHRPVIGSTPERMSEFEESALRTVDVQAEQIHAWCILPNHYHILVTTDRLDDLLSAIGQMHGRTSYRWNGEEQCRGRQVWHGCADRAMRTEGHFWATTNYIHHNPVKHMYVEQWLDWPFSSAKSYLHDVGREEARRIWRDFPVLDYGKGWDDPEM